MGLESIDRSLVTHDLVQDLKWDRTLRERFERDEASVLDQYRLTKTERKAIEQRDFRTLYDLGLHPYLGAQFARILYRSRTAGGAAAARALNASLNGREISDDVPMPGSAGEEG